MAIRDVTWTFRIDPLRRLDHASTLAGAKTDVTLNRNQIDFWQIAMNACDLFFNLRGLGWDWSVGLRVPIHTRPTYSRSAFLSATVRDALITSLIFDIFHYSVQWFSPSTIGSAQGGTIFDPSLPPVQRYIRSTLMTSLGGLTLCFGIQVFYDVGTIIGVLVFCQTPEQWPPVFNQLWLTTSVAEFWNIRWHQTFRDNLIRLGFIPFAFFFGKLGGVMGAFLLSGVMHFVGLWATGNGGEFINMICLFLIMGVGTLLEYTFKKVTGRRVQGWWGRIWTFLWLVGWLHILMEAWCMKGLAGAVFFPTNIRPSYRLLGPLPWLISYIILGALRSFVFRI